MTIGAVTDFCFGGGTIDLGSGLFWGSGLVFSSGTTVASNASAGTGLSGLTTASTSISFTVSAGAFDAGSITIYGVK